MEPYRTFKAVVVGESQTGKTSFFERKRNGGGFSETYEPTSVAKYLPVDCQSNEGWIRFDCIDTPGGRKFEGLDSFSYYAQADCAIIMYDVTEELTHVQETTTKWHQELSSNYGRIPIVLCGNKVDLNNRRRVRAGEIKLDRQKKNIRKCEISVKDGGSNIDVPFLYLARMLFREESASICCFPTGSRRGYTMGALACDSAQGTRTDFVMPLRSASDKHTPTPTPTPTPHAYIFFVSFQHLIYFSSASNRYGCLQRLARLPPRIE